MSYRLHSFLFFILYFGITIWLYLPTAGAGFVTDEVGWVTTYKAMGWHGLLNAFGDKSLHFVYHLAGFAAWKILALNGPAWLILFGGLHAVAATLSFHVFRKMFVAAQAKFPMAASFLGSMIFLLSPYQTEVLVWYACLHYLVCSVLLLLALNSFINYLHLKQRKYILIYYSLFAASVFTLEISFTFPLIVAAIILFFPLLSLSYDKAKSLLWFVLPSLIIVILYFLLNKILRGSFAGHYGSETHFNFSLPLLIGNLSKYSFKIFGLAQFFSYENRNAIFLLFENPKIAYCIFATLLLIAAAFFIWYKKTSAFMKVTGVLFGAFVFALGPILNLFFYHVTNVEGDRFSYFASLFAYQLVSFALISWFSYIGMMAVVLFLFLHVKFLVFNIESWANNSYIANSLIDKFRWYDAPKIFILNIPDNYRGTYMFRTYAPDNYFAETLMLKKEKDIGPRVAEILEYNMNELSDGVSVEKVSDRELKVTFKQQGNWWWQKGIGGGSYSTTAYDVQTDQWSHAYNIVFKTKTPGAVYLYQTGDNWEEIKDF